MFSDQAAKTCFSILLSPHVLNKAIVQDSDQTAQTFSGSKVQYRVIIKQTTHACHNQTGQSFSGINITSQHAGANFLVYYIGRTRS